MQFFMIQSIKLLWTETFGFDSGAKAGILFSMLCGVPSRVSATGGSALRNANCCFNFKTVFAPLWRRPGSQKVRNSLYFYPLLILNIGLIKCLFPRLFVA